MANDTKSLRELTGFLDLICLLFLGSLTEAFMHQSLVTTAPPPLRQGLAVKIKVWHNDF